jgi:hypothetical protein
MTNITATFQCPAVSPTLPAGQLPPVKLNTHRVEFHHGPTSPRVAAKQTGKRLRDMTSEQRQDFLRRKGVKTVEPTGPDPIETAQTSQAALQRGFLGMVYDYTLGALENALAEDETKPEAAKPDQKPDSAPSKTMPKDLPVNRPFMDDFLIEIEGRFACPDKLKLRDDGIFDVISWAEPGRTLDGKVLLIGTRGEVSQKWAEGLFENCSIEGDKIVVAASPAALENEAYRNTICMGASKEDCIAGEPPGANDLVDAALNNWIRLLHRRLFLLDPEAADSLQANHASRDAHQYLRLLDERYWNSFSLRLRSLFLSADESVEIDQLQEKIEAAGREYSALASQAEEAKRQNYVRLLEREMTNHDATIYVPIDIELVGRIEDSFRHDARVISLYATNLGPRRNRRVYG